jgi:hypothetical protein
MQGIMQGLYPDGKAQMAIEYENNTPIAIANLVISTHHAPSLSRRDLGYQLIEYVMKPVMPHRILSYQMMDRERDRFHPLEVAPVFRRVEGAACSGPTEAQTHPSVLSAAY